MLSISEKIDVLSDSVTNYIMDYLCSDIFKCSKIIFVKNRKIIFICIGKYMICLNQDLYQIFIIQKFYENNLHWIIIVKRGYKNTFYIKVNTCTGPATWF